MAMLDDIYVGMKVKIDPECRFSHQCTLTGEVQREKPNSSNWWEVLFPNGYNNVYKKRHLIKPIISNKSDSLLPEDVVSLFKGDRLQ
jgi:hypothetical protein